MTRITRQVICFLKIDSELRHPRRPRSRDTVREYLKQAAAYPLEVTDRIVVEPHRQPENNLGKHVRASSQERLSCVVLRCVKKIPDAAKNGLVMLLEGHSNGASEGAHVGQARGRPLSPKKNPRAKIKLQLQEPRDALARTGFAA